LTSSFRHFVIPGKKAGNNEVEKFPKVCRLAKWKYLKVKLSEYHQEIAPLHPEEKSGFRCEMTASI